MKQERKENLEAELQRIIPEIIKLDVEKVILFGSLVTGKIHSKSDIDLIIIKRTDKRFMDRLDEFYNYVSPNVATDMLVYTPEEFEEMKLNSQFTRTALKNSKVMYER
ncbi:TPA: nucleotidyltransferase domain-containing protein [Candidatus Poribacteria bacterium]|nr:nucleotidyltransferase domain-containing protein [Candidatus Poribacteria bacterium]